MRERERHTHMQNEKTAFFLSSFPVTPPAGHAAHSAARLLIARVTSEREKQDYHSERYGRGYANSLPHITPWKAHNAERFICCKTVIVLKMQVFGFVVLCG
jgi:hypothetical protein